MNKFLAIILALLLSMSAFADTGSKTISDEDEDPIVTPVTPTEADEEELVTAYVKVIDPEDEGFKELNELCAAEIEVLAELEEPIEYFGDYAAQDGTEFDIPAYIEAADESELVVYEMEPIIAGGWEELKADECRLYFDFLTAYTPGEKVAVMIGVIYELNAVEPGESRRIEWTAYPGVAVELPAQTEASAAAESVNNGRIAVTFDLETLLTISNNETVIAVVSAKHADTLPGIELDEVFG